MPPLLLVLQPMNSPTGSDVPKRLWSLARLWPQIPITIPNPKSGVHDTCRIYFPCSQELQRISPCLCLVAHCTISPGGSFCLSVVLWVLKTADVMSPLRNKMSNFFYLLDLLSRVYMKTHELFSRGLHPLTSESKQSPGKERRMI